MSYHYYDKERIGDPHAMPNCEVFYVGYEKKDAMGFGVLECHICSDWTSDDNTEHSDHIGWYYAFGFPGCLWDSEPIGPFDTKEGALAAARETD